MFLNIYISFVKLLGARRKVSMLTNAQLDRLESHIVGILKSVVLPEVMNDGCILVQDSNGETVADPVTTHHLVELCLEIDDQLCAEIVNRACAWFIKQSQTTQDPFFVTTVLRAGQLDKKFRNQILSQLIKAQRPSGFIDLYAGFLDGGSIFSTLWAIRILRLTGAQVEIKKPVAKALEAVRKHWTDVHRASFKGFYLELALNAKGKMPNDQFAQNALKEILESQDAVGMWDDNPLYTAYVLGNLSLLISNQRTNMAQKVAFGFKELFSLDDDVKGVPNSIAAVQKTYVESVYLQTVIRAALSAVRYLRCVHGRSVRDSLASSVLGAYTTTYQAARALGVELKRMNSQYGGIHERFAHLDKFAGTLLKESQYEDNIFVMMPFRQGRDERYEAIERILRTELRKHGFRAWLASDRTLAPQLWDNVASFLLACKYAVAVFTRIERDNRIEQEFNPNVSLELGFCLSRGRRILILKDSALKRLQTDLVGHLYEEFDLNQVSRQLPRIVRRWAKSIQKNSSS